MIKYTDTNLPSDSSGREKSRENIRANIDPTWTNSWPESLLMFYLFHVAVLSLSKKSAHNHSEELERNDQGKEKQWRETKEDSRQKWYASESGK